MIPESIQAARLRLAAQRPYLAAALWALTPVERQGLGTLAVDRWWRLYYDPAVCQAWTVEELAGVLYHEISHLLRAHHERAEGWEPVAANLSTDCEINDDLLREGVRLPGQPITPAMLGQPKGLLAEEYYAALQAQQSAPQQGQAAQPPGGGEPAAGDTRQGDGNEAGQQGANDSAAGDADTVQDTAPASGGADAGCGSDPSPMAEGGGQAMPQAGGSGGASPSQPGGPAGSQAGAGGGSMPSPASSQPAGPSGHCGAPSQPAAVPVGNGSAGGSSGTPPAAGAQTPAPGAGRCGSCAHGHQEPWEDGPPGNGGTPGISRAEAELIRRQVAEAIRIAAASDTRGAVPGHWKRWAEEKLRPKVDWRRELAAAVRHAIADIAGAADYSYRRPSRRQAVSQAILPALRQPVPEVAVVVDTSGSIDDRQVARALAEVAGILRGLGNRAAVRVLAVDAAVQACRRVFRPEQVELKGGGGTDMRVGIEAALRLRPRPQVVVVITDGHTPWPERPPSNARVIVALVGDGQAPAWARAVRIKEDT